MRISFGGASTRHVVPYCCLGLTLFCDTQRHNTQRHNTQGHNTHHRTRRSGGQLTSCSIIAFSRCAWIVSRIMLWHVASCQPVGHEAVPCTPQVAEGKKLLERELVQRLPPEEIRTATFVKQAMANTKVGTWCVHDNNNNNNNTAIYVWLFYSIVYSPLMDPAAATTPFICFRLCRVIVTLYTCCVLLQQRRPRSGCQQPISRHAVRRWPPPPALPAAQQRHEHIVQPTNICRVWGVCLPQHSRRPRRGADRLFLEFPVWHHKLHNVKDPQAAVPLGRAAVPLGRACAPRTTTAVNSIDAQHRKRCK